MDSFHKFSFQIPRFITVICAEWISDDEGTLLEQLVTSTQPDYQTTRFNDNDGNHAPTRTSSGLDIFGRKLPSQSVWFNALIPNYQDLSQSSGEMDVIFKTGWQKVIDKGKCSDQEEQKGEGDGAVFSAIMQKFNKSRSDIIELPKNRLREHAGKIASELDKMADELPTGGFHLDVVWLMPTTTDYPILERSDAFLFSVLRRLEVWHGARINIVIRSDVAKDDHPSLTNWTTFLDCRVVTLGGADPVGEQSEGICKPEDILTSSASLAWQGQVKYISSRGTSFPPWSGFSLHRLNEDISRSEPFIEILDTDEDPGQEVAGSQEAMGGIHSTTLSDMMPKHIVSDTLEFIHLANLDEIPSWFILPGKFELRLKEKEQRQRFSRSHFWLRYLTHRLPGDGQGAICQLSCLELDGHAPMAKTRGLSTEAWTRDMTSHPLEISTPNVQLKGKNHTFFFLVHGDRKGRCIAVPLVSPYKLNGAAHALLARHDTEEYTTSQTDGPSAREVLESLPLLNGRQLKEDEEDLARMQIKALTMVIEKIRADGLHINVTPSLLIFLFNYMRKIFYEGHDIDEDILMFDSSTPSINNQGSHSSSHSASHVHTEGSRRRRSSARAAAGTAVQSEEHQTTPLHEDGAQARVQDGTAAAPSQGTLSRQQKQGEDNDQELVEKVEGVGDEGGGGGGGDGIGGASVSINLQNIPTELDQSPSQWVERQALQNRESIASRLRRLKSEDMTLAGITVPPPDSNTITLSAKEFLSHFRPNGQPKSDDLMLGKPALVKNSPRTREALAGHHSSFPSNEELISKDFHTSLKLKYHGINYCHDTPDSHSIDQRMIRLQRRCVRQEMSCTFTAHHQPTLAQPTLAIVKKRKHSASPSSQKSKVRKLSASAKKRPSTSRGHLTPRKSHLTPRKRTSRSKSRTPSKKGRGATPRTVTTPKSWRKRVRSSTTGGLTPKRLKQRTPKKSTESTPKKAIPPADMPTPRRSARKLARDQQSISASSATSITATTSATATSSTNRPSATSPSLPSSSKATRKANEKTESTKPRRTSSTSSESRSDKHKRKLRSIVEETLKEKGIDSKHSCFKQCVTRLYTQTKMFVKDLKTSKGLYDEMRKIAEAQADFVVQFELQRMTPKT